jgi:hypothetical protein
MASDYDVPGIHAEACDLVVYRTLEYIYERLKDPMKKADAQMEYARLLRQHAARYGVGIPSSSVVKRRPARG